MSYVCCPDCGSEWRTAEDMSYHRQDCAAAWRNENDRLRAALEKIASGKHGGCKDDGYVEFCEVYFPAEEKSWCAQCVARMALAQPKPGQARREEPTR